MDMCGGRPMWVRCGRRRLRRRTAVLDAGGRWGVLRYQTIGELKKESTIGECGRRVGGSFKYNGIRKASGIFHLALGSPHAHPSHPCLSCTSSPVPSSELLKPQDQRTLPPLHLPPNDRVRLLSRCLRAVHRSAEPCLQLGSRDQKASLVKSLPSLAHTPRSYFLRFLR